MAKLQIGVNDLLTWCRNNDEQGERLIQEWVGLDENDNSISMNSVTKGSNKKVKWRCQDCKRVWIVNVVSRTGAGSNCPVCADNKLIPGKNDLYSWCLQNVEQGQRLIQEWLGLDENNNPISMDSVTKGSNKKVKWKCSKCNHEWIATVYSRTQGRNCRMCGFRLVSEKNSTPIQGVNDLHTWCLQNGEQGQRLIEEWQGLDENNNLIYMDSVTKASAKRVRWKCIKCNYEWISTVSDRTRGRNCPVCANILISEKKSTPIQGVNDLHTWCLQAGEQGQRLISEWTGIDQDNNPISMDSLTKGSHKKVKWRCKDCTYEWISTVNDRTQGHACPVCAGNTLIPGKNDLYTWCKNNGERGQQLLREWIGLEVSNY